MILKSYNKMIIAFEGHDGVGKSTIVVAISKLFAKKGLRVATVSNTENGFLEIRKHVDEKNDLEQSFRFYLMCNLLAMAVADSLLSEHDLILMDRSIYSTFVSHTALGYQIPIDPFAVCNIPDICFWIQVDEKIRQHRILKEKNKISPHDLESLNDSLIGYANNLYSKFDLIPVDNSKELEHSVQFIEKYLIERL